MARRLLLAALAAVADAAHEKYVIQGFDPAHAELIDAKPPDGFSTIGDFPNLTQGMEKAGWSEDRIRKVMGENWLRLLENVWGG